MKWEWRWRKSNPRKCSCESPPQSLVPPLTCGFSRPLWTGKARQRPGSRVFRVSACPFLSSESTFRKRSDTRRRVDSECVDELVDADVRLPQHGPQGPGRELPMEWHDGDPIDV